MEEIRYIHAADLHMDSPFQGLARGIPQEKQLKTALHGACSRALDNLVRLCESEKPDFLVLAGDSYNADERSLQAQLEIRHACQRLHESEIKVFMVHGTHDPFASRFARIGWPSNVTVFGPEPESRVFEKNGQAAAIVHGASQSAAKEKENLASLFARDKSSDGFQLGVLHCSLKSGGREDGAASLGDLVASDLDAWALGHAHKRALLCERPFIACPGTFQGRNIGESGQHGCLLVTAEKLDGSWHCEGEFRALAPVVWERAEISIAGLDSLDMLEKRVSDYMENYRAGVDGSLEAVIFEIHLKGHGVLDAALRKKETLEKLAASLGHFSYGRPGMWIKDVRLESMLPVMESETWRRDDIVGETARISRDLLEHEQELERISGAAIEPLFSQARFKSVLPQLEAGQIQEILVRAQAICQDLLEKR